MGQHLEIYSNTFGFIIPIPIEWNILDIGKLRLRIRNANGRILDKELPTDEQTFSNKTFLYVVEKTDFTSPGTYQLQLFNETGNLKLASPIVKIRVRPSLDYSIN